VNTCGCDWRDDYICSWHRQVKDEVARIADELIAELELVLKEDSP
jgi:hypothetical protein